MFDPKIIRQEFLGLVGLRQTDNPEFQKLAANLLYNGDNILINHPLINAENIEMLAKNFSGYDYDAWNNLTSYFPGDRVKEAGIIYEALTNNVAADPASSPDDWDTVDLLSLYLEDIFTTSAEEVVNNMFNLKKDVHRTKTLISTMRFYEGAGNLNDKILNTGKLVGVKVELNYSMNLVAIVERIGTQFTAVGSDIPIYIYHSSQPKPIQTILFNQTVPGGFQWTNPAAKIKLHSLNQMYDAGGYFFIMYDQNNMGGGMAINKRMNFNLPCPSCSQYNMIAFQRISKYISLMACSVNPANRFQDGVQDDEGTDLWDIEKTLFDSDVNWGLNFDFTVRCDATDFIVRQKDVFGYAYRDTVIVKILENLAASTRQNNMQTKVNDLANIALSSKAIGGGGAREKADASVKNIDFEMSALDNVCLPCANDAGIKVKAFGLQNMGNNLTGGN